ncbi:hypothetical protein CR513_09722, partial [Mucuna pruriens]
MIFFCGSEFKTFTKRKTRNRRLSATQLEKIVSKEFAYWFLHRVTNPYITDVVPNEIKYLARGPMAIARRYTAYNINGYKFRTMGRDEGLKTQNNGVFLTSSTSCVASQVDANLRLVDLPYYGKLEDIIELNYYGFLKVILFRCKWADTTRPRGFRKDAWQFTSVNFSHCIHTDGPYIEASQAQMVYYVDDEVNKGWSVVVHMMPRDLYDMGEVGEDITFESEPYHEQDLSNLFTNETETITLTRNDVDDEFVTISHVENQLQGDANIFVLNFVVVYILISLVNLQLQLLGGALNKAPTQQSDIPLMASTQRPHVGRESSREWTVEAIDEQGKTKKIQLTKSGVFEMPCGERIIVPFDRQMRAYGEAASLLVGACGRIATDLKNIPINFDNWQKVPKSYRNGKMNLWNNVYDTSLSREQLIAKVLDGIHKDQWLSFVDYHLREEHQELCQKNSAIRKKQIIPHTGGSKLLSTKQHEMEVELGRAVGRGELYIVTHKKKDGSYVNEEARFIGEKMTQEISQSIDSTEISSNDSLSKVLGKDHVGRVRCLGLGGLHSVAFQSTTRFSGVGCIFSNSNSAEKEIISISLKDKLASSEESVKTLKNVMLAYIQMKEGYIPTKLEAMFGSTSNVVVSTSYIYVN